MRVVKVGEVYKHFKGHIVKVIAIAYDTENYDDSNPDAAKLVVYEKINAAEGWHGPKVWARPYNMFTSEVDHDKYPDVKQKYRFEKVEED